MTDDIIIDEIMADIKYAYRECGILSMNHIDELVSYLIETRVFNDEEFKEALGDGYYT
jgi:hypothetical protein